MKLIVLLLVLLSVTGLARADSEQDLADSTDDFERVKAAISNRVNMLQQEKRTAIWTQYYRALEHLRRMDIHHKMMVQHNKDRSEQFRKEYSEFVNAMERLRELLPNPR